MAATLIARAARSATPASAPADAGERPTKEREMAEAEAFDLLVVGVTGARHDGVHVLDVQLLEELVEPGVAIEQRILVATEAAHRRASPDPVRVGARQRRRIVSAEAIWVPTPDGLEHPCPARVVRRRWRREVDQHAGRDRD